MKRRIVIASCLIAAVGGSTISAVAAPIRTTNHQVCIELADHEQYQNAQYLCVSTPN